MESRQFSPTGLDLGLLRPSLDAPPGPGHTSPSPLARFSTLTRTVWRLRADGGGRSPRSCVTEERGVVRVFCTFNPSRLFCQNPPPRKNLLVRVQQEAEQLVVLRLPGGGPQRGAGRRFPLDADLVLAESVLGGGGRVAGAVVLQQPVQDLVALGQAAVGGGARCGGVLRMAR